MKPDQERVKTLLSQTVTLLCKNGLHYEKELRIQGLLGITIDCESVFIVHFNESLSDFTSDVSPLLAGAAASVEGCPEKPEKSRSAAISAGKPVTVCSETEADKSCSSLDEIRKPSPLHESGHAPSENAEMPLSLDEDLKTVKTERNSEDDCDDVVLVESENEQDIGSLTGSLFPASCSESAESRMRRDNRRHRQSLPPVANSSKRRRLALPAPMESAAVYGDGGGNGYNVKMEPHSSEYLGGGEQALPYDEGYPEHSWDNSKTIFNQADTVEDLTSVPGCSSWDGFDLQARGSATSGATPRSNELYHESWTYAKFERRTTTPAAQSTLSHSTVSSHDNTVALRQGSGGGTVSTFRRSRGGGSTVKTVVCQYPDCGKTFCHSYHLYRHQREKHGRRFGVISQMSFMCRYPECGRVFYRMASLWNHENLVHNVAPGAT